MVWNLNRICPFQKKHNYFLPLVDTWFNNSLDHLDPGLDGTDHWCFHCYHVGGECGQGLFYNLFYMADPVFWTALAAEAGAARPLGVMLDGCRWLHENSVRVRGFPTVPRPCGDFIEEGRCQEARMFCANLGFCFCWSFCFLLAVFGHGWLFFFCVCVCGLPCFFFFRFLHHSNFSASWQCCMIQSGNRSLSQDHWRRWLFRVFTSQAEDVSFRWGWELVHWEHATDLCH